MNAPALFNPAMNWPGWLLLRSVIRSLVVFTLMLLAPLGMAQETLSHHTSLPGSHPVESSPVGAVLFSKGAALLLRAETQQAVSRGAQLQVGDTLITGDQSRMLIRLNDGSKTTLGANSRYQILSYDHASGDGSASAFRLIEGAFKTVTGAIARDEGSYRVETALGTIGIRGTTFWGGYLDPGKIDVLLIKGDRAVVVANDRGSVVLGVAGEGTTLLPDVQPGPVKRWPQSKVDRAVATVVWPELDEPSSGLDEPSPR